MIVRRKDIAAVLAKYREGRTGTIEPSEGDTTKIWAFGQRALPVMAQAEAALWEAMQAPLAPCMAALAVALHQAEPGLFRFGNCRCNDDYLELSRCHERPDTSVCDRRLWLEQMRDRMRMPASIDTPQTIKPVRG